MLIDGGTGYQPVISEQLIQPLSATESTADTEVQITRGRAETVMDKDVARVFNP